MDAKVTKRVIGIGGIFSKAEDPQKLRAWYEHHRGIKSQRDEGASFPWRRADEPYQETFTAWSIFPRGTTYFQSKHRAILDQLSGRRSGWAAGGAQG